MYKIVGGDGNQYGPVSADEVRKWIAEGRLNGQSLVWAEGAKDWQPVCAFPEFATALQAKAGPAPAPIGPLGPGMAETYVVETLARYPEVPIGYCLSRSWLLLKSNAGLLFGATAIVWAIRTVCSFVPLLGPFIDLVIHGIFLGGLYVVFLKRIRGEPAGIRDVFAGFSAALPQLLLAGILTEFLEMFGLICCCVLPGIYLIVAWAFSLPLIADRRLEFWSAMELSRKVVTRVWVQIFGLLLVAYLPLILASIAIGIISSFTSSAQSQELSSIFQAVFSGGQLDPAALMNALKEVMTSQYTLVNLLISLCYKIVLLLNMPFAVGALMYAYEALFGARQSPSA